MASPPLAVPAVRHTSRDPEAFAPITGREEEWRFTPLARMRGLHDGSATVDAVLPVTLTVPAGARVETISGDHPLVGSVLVPADKAAALAMAGVKEAQLVTVDGELAEPVVLAFEGTGGTSYGHVVVDVLPFGKAVVVLDHTGTATHSGAVEVRVGDSADVTLVSLQDWGDDAVHLGAQAARVGRDARYKSVVVTLGGDLVRLNPTVEYAGPGGSAELLGLAFADAGQHLEHRLLVTHTVPSCTSRVTYKAAAQGVDAHTVWIGDVAIKPEATGTDTYELNRNLLLSDEARADSVPNLEIETGEIAGAGHASATGRFDEGQLFYLQARGIQPAEAKRMVVRGFFAEILARIGVPSLEERLLTAIDEELA
ncbi:MAG TPA: Fe-S cluster assembly protein SufD [Mycobacteriales bacterium]|nr:Fe-S cluster assembly protein SufD [Mycobacteriales bacterium]